MRFQLSLNFYVPKEDTRVTDVLMPKVLALFKEIYPDAQDVGAAPFATVTWFATKSDEENKSETEVKPDKPQ